MADRVTPLPVGVAESLRHWLPPRKAKEKSGAGMTTLGLKTNPLAGWAAGWISDSLLKPEQRAIVFLIRFGIKAR